MSQGVRTKAGYKDAAAWGESWAAADTILPYTSESIARTYQMNRSAALIGQVAAHEFEHGVQGNAGDMPLELDFNNLGLLEHALGDVNGGVYSFTNELAQYFHIEIDKVAKRYRYGGCMIGSFQMAADSASEQPIMWTPSITARSCVEHSNAIAALTDTQARVYWKHLTAGYCRINILDAALDDQDNQTIKSFGLSVENNLQTDLIDTDSATYYQAPIRNGFRTVELTVGFGRYNAHAVTLQGLHAADTRVQAELFMTGSGGTIKIQLPAMKIKSGLDFNVGGPAVLEGDVTFEAHYNGSGGSAKNSNMSVVDQMEITVT